MEKKTVIPNTTGIQLVVGRYHLPGQYNAFQDDVDVFIYPIIGWEIESGNDTWWGLGSPVTAHEIGPKPKFWGMLTPEGRVLSSYDGVDKGSLNKFKDWVKREGRSFSKLDAAKAAIKAATTS